MAIREIIRLGVKIAVPLGAALMAAGGKMHYDSKKTIEQCQAELDAATAEYEVVRTKAVAATDELGRLELEVQKDFARFADAFEMIKNRPRFSDMDLSDGFDLSVLKVGELKKASIKAANLLCGAVAMAGAGTFAGAAIYGGVLTLGVASTGTPIVMLAGAAAKNAALAALGGGSIATGGGGMAAGTMLLGGAVAAAAIVAGGTALAVKGLMDRGKAKKAKGILTEAVADLETSKEFMKRLRSAADLHRRAIEEVYGVYIEEVSKLEELVSRKKSYRAFTEEEKVLLSNNILLVKLLKEMTETALVGGKKDEVMDERIKALVEKSSDVLASLG